jgi:hypothetical protein
MEKEKYEIIKYMEVENEKIIKANGFTNTCK